MTVTLVTTATVMTAVTMVTAASVMTAVTVMTAVAVVTAAKITAVDSVMAACYGKMAPAAMPSPLRWQRQHLLNINPLPSTLTMITVGNSRERLRKTIGQSS